MAVALLLGVLPAIHAQEKMFKREVALTGTLGSYDHWELEVAGTYYFIPYLGGTLGLGLFHQYASPSLPAIPGIGNRHWMIDEDNREVAKLLIRPGIRLRTPVWWLDSDQNTGVFLQLEPSLGIALPANECIDFVRQAEEERIALPPDAERFKNKGGDWLFGGVRAAVSLRIDRAVLSAGYGYSTFDAYGGRRNIVVGQSALRDYLPTKRPCHTAFLSVGYPF